MSKEKYQIHEPANCEEYAEIERKARAKAKKEPKNRFWKCMTCGCVGYTQGPESHTCPGKDMQGSQPDCSKCWDKGYFTELTGGQTIHADFIGDRTQKTGPILVIRFCICRKGKLAQRRKEKIAAFETETYKLPTDFKKITNIQINGKHYGRHKAKRSRNSTQFDGKSRESRTKGAKAHARKKGAVS